MMDENESEPLIHEDHHSINSRHSTLDKKEEAIGDMTQPEVIEFKETDSFLEPPDIRFRSNSFNSLNGKSC